MQNKGDITIEETDSLRALDAATGYFRDPAFAKNRDALKTDGKWWQRRCATIASNVLTRKRTTP